MIPPLTYLLVAFAPPAPPGANVVIVERVYAPFNVVGSVSEFPASRRQSISSVFSSYTGIATGDILTTARDAASGVDIVVDHTVPTGTSGASIASTLNNGIMRSRNILQAALQNTGGTIVNSVGDVSIVESYEYVYPPPGPGPPLSETLIIIITVGGVLGLIALIGVARYCDAGKLRETTRLLLGIARTATGGGPPAVEDDDDEKKKGQNINIVVKTDGDSSKKTTDTSSNDVDDPPRKETKESRAKDDGGGGAVSKVIMAKGRDLLRQLISDDDGDTKRSAKVGSRE